MEENKNIIETQESNTTNDDELRVAIEEQVSKIQSKLMIVGFRVACSTILNKINDFERSGGNKSNNDHKRLIKDIKKFVEQGLVRNIDENGKIEITEETTQN